MLALTPPYLRMTSPSESGRNGSARSVSEALASSLAPALDFAFGVDHGGTLPPEIASHIAALHRGPLGSPVARPRARAEGSA
ncbi:MAG: hypothetical protein K2Y56_16270 [Methylobacterium sp.]|uniref:hypothetical protein n=1 Tax=Methylobacterium sp. TaxID=409 RepID=UPI002600B8CE|nr:hypothetical protein [Methylobacterium sp.]MBX9933067.1 hypothetical protein [Methylobacterium sp.]